MDCPIARSLERVGEWWSILILRNALYGLTRFDEFQKTLAIAPNILARRLNVLVEAGLLERRQYCAKPPRFEYLLTHRGRDFRPVLLTLMAWGNKHFAPEGKFVMLVDSHTGLEADPVLMDAVTGERITEQDHVVVAGPAANEPIRRHLARAGGRPGQGKGDSDDA